LCDVITYYELKGELSRRVPALKPKEVEELVAAFIDIAGGKYVCGKNAAKKRRNEELRSSFNGKNLAQLTSKYHLSPRQVRRILKIT